MSGSKTTATLLALSGETGSMKDENTRQAEGPGVEKRCQVQGLGRAGPPVPSRVGLLAHF